MYTNICDFLPVEARDNAKEAIELLKHEIKSSPSQPRAELHKSLVSHEQEPSCIHSLLNNLLHSTTHKEIALELSKFSFHTVNMALTQNAELLRIDGKGDSIPRLVALAVTYTSDGKKNETFLMSEDVEEFERDDFDPSDGGWHAKKKYEK